MTLHKLDYESEKDRSGWPIRAVALGVLWAVVIVVAVLTAVAAYALIVGPWLFGP